MEDLNQRRAFKEFENAPPREFEIIDSPLERAIICAKEVGSRILKKSLASDTPLAPVIDLDEYRRKVAERRCRTGR